MISVIMPVMGSYDMTLFLFEQMVRNSVLPQEVFLIDNGSDEDCKFYKFEKMFPELNVHYSRYKFNHGVNIAWNDGIKDATGNYLMFLNNDIIINRYFFEKVMCTLLYDATVGVVVPTTVKSLDKMYDDPGEPVVENIDRREGWAFTIRREITEASGYIPFPFKIYYGDDYLFQWAKKLGYSWQKITNCPIYHYGSRSVKQIDKNNTVLVRECRYWEKLYRSFFFGEDE
jgi:GT2 family glycosyltransferase